MQLDWLKRREFISLLGGAAAWPIAARAQQPAMPVVGFLHTRAPEDFVAQVEAFRRALAENGYVDGQNLSIEFRWARGQYDQLPTMAAELVRRPVNRPGGNVTGIDNLTTDLSAKRLGLLHEVAPRAETIGVLLNPDSPVAQTQLGDVQAAASALGLHIRELHASSVDDVDAAFDRAGRERIAALLVQADPFYDTRRVRSSEAIHTQPTRSPRPRARAKTSGADRRLS
jgi:putative tryptophan/tyrosine transport system substrate-binding protein